MSGIVQQVKIKQDGNDYQAYFTQNLPGGSKGEDCYISLYTNDTVEIETQSNNLSYKSNLAQNIVNFNSAALDNVFSAVNVNNTANLNNISTSSAAGVVFNG